MYCTVLLMLLSYVSSSDNLGPLHREGPTKAGLGASQHSGFPGQRGINDQLNRWMLQETSTLPSLEEQKISFEYFLNQLEDSPDLYSNTVNKISANDERTFKPNQNEEKSKENNKHKVNHLTSPDFSSTRRKPTLEIKQQNSENFSQNGKLPEIVGSRPLNSLFEPSVDRNSHTFTSSQPSLFLINSLKRIAKKTLALGGPTREDINCLNTLNHERLGKLKSDDSLFIPSLRYNFMPRSRLRSSMGANPNMNPTPLVIEEQIPIQNTDLIDSQSSTKRIDLFANFKECSISDLKESSEFSPFPIDNTIQKDFLPKREKREATSVNFNPSTPDPSSLLPDWAEFAADSGSVKGGWPVRRVCELPGELLLGGLVMVHERSDTVTCGPVMPQGGIQALETMLYTLDVINSRHQLPFTLGAHILDDCDKDTYGLEMAVDFIKGSISNIDDAEYLCNKTQVRKVISGVVGAASSVTSIQVANLLRLFKIPQVSYWSTSPELSNKQRFEYFSRTIPSDHHQAQAMVELVKRLGWSYVSIIYEESNYGIKAFEELEQLLAKAGVCIAVKEKLAKDSGVAEDRAYDNVVLKLQTKPRARGAIVFASDQEVAGLMRAVRRCNATGSFSWIGSDGWSARSLVSEGSEPEVEGTLSVQPQANPVTGFDQYFLNLTVENNRRNPWFVEFWEDHFQCRYPGSPATPYNQRYSRNCGPQDRLTRDNTAFENQLQFVSDAVMSLAVALGDMHVSLCKTGPLCAAMTPTSGSDLLRFLRRVNFKGLSGDKFHFDSSGDGPARYNIIHFKQTQPGTFQWVHVGEYVEGELRLNMSEIQFNMLQPHPPESVCSLPCELGQAKTYVEGESCCWHCFNCTAYQIRDPEDETQCVPCAAGTRPDPLHQVCLAIPEDFLRAESGWAIGAMSFSLAGILATLFVTAVFARHNDTPVVKAAGRELTYVLLAGILLCYLITFALVLRPSDLVCGVQRFGAGFSFTVVYAALLTKTNRISRIFNAGKRTAKRPSFITPKSQLIICSGLVSLQVLVNIVWMVVSPPRAIHHYPRREDNLLICSSYVDASYMIAFGYPILLILVCTVYAVLTRNIPEAFNESKHIGFTMYTTCVIWLAFVPLYFGTGNNMALRITSMSVTISLSASVTVACLFSPKLYIILIRPERNVRQSMMPTQRPVSAAPTVTSLSRVPHTATEVTLLSKLTESRGKEDNNQIRIDPLLTTSRATQTEVSSEISEPNGPQM